MTYYVRSLLLYALVALQLGVQPSIGVAACPVLVIGEGLAAWQEAIANLPQASLDGDDCARVLLELHQGSARLTFTTRDGRHALRTLQHPDELAPTLAALSVVGEGATTSSAEATARKPAAQRTPEPASMPAQPGHRSRDIDALLTLLGGVHVGGRALLSPTLGASALLRVRRWEVGVLATWEAQYYDLREPGARNQASAVAPVLTCARRESIARFTLLYGVRAGVAVVIPNIMENTAAAGSSNVATPGPHRREARAGAFLGAALPATALARFRIELGAAFAFAQQSFPTQSERPPSWAVTAALGLELGRP